MPLSPVYLPGEYEELCKRGAHFNEEYFSDPDHWYEDYITQQEKFYKGMDTRILNLTERVPNERHIDVGCSFGWFVKRLEDQGIEAYGVDISKFAVDSAFSKNVFVGDSLRVPFDDGLFDIVWSIGVLMYFDIPDVYKAVDELCRLSKRYVVLSSLTRTCTQSDQRVNGDQFRKAVLPSWQDFDGLFLKHRMKKICHRPWRYHYAWNAVYERF